MLFQALQLTLAFVLAISTDPINLIADPSIEFLCIGQITNDIQPNTFEFLSAEPNLFPEDRIPFGCSQGGSWAIEEAICGNEKCFSISNGNNNAFLGSEIGVLSEQATRKNLWIIKSAPKDNSKVTLMNYETRRFLCNGLEVNGAIELTFKGDNSERNKLCQWNMKNPFERRRRALINDILDVDDIISAIFDKNNIFPFCIGVRDGKNNELFLGERRILDNKCETQWLIDTIDCRSYGSNIQCFSIKSSNSGKYLSSKFAENFPGRVSDTLGETEIFQIINGNNFGGFGLLLNNIFRDQFVSAQSLLCGDNNNINVWSQNPRERLCNWNIQVSIN